MKQNKPEFGRLVQLKIKRKFSNLKSSDFPGKNQRTSPFHTKIKLTFAYFIKKPIKSTAN